METQWLHGELCPLVTSRKVVAWPPREPLKLSVELGVSENVVYPIVPNG